MVRIQDINWNNFKAKFNGREQKSFELLCYLLFCSEFNIHHGVFRYKNQAGIEAEPIEHNGQFIGFQSKFYETKISDNVEDIKDSITKARNKNPNLNKLLFYINQEFSESSNKQQKDPQYKTEIETHAASKRLEIEWRVPSHFEIQLAIDKNIKIAQFFFSLDKGQIDFIEEFHRHTELILAPIHSKIEFKGNTIKIDRSEALKNFHSVLNKSSIIILSGEGGVGKTAVIKDFYDQIHIIAPMFIFKATEFNISNINELFKIYGNFTLSDFISEYQDVDKKYIVIDSAEKLSDAENQEAFQEFLSALLKSNWKIIFTTRYSYLDDLKAQFIEIYHLSFQIFNVDNLSPKELIELSKGFCFNLPDNERLNELLQNPFYLNEYLQNYNDVNNSISLSDFKALLWNKQIIKAAYRKGNAHIKREDCFLKIAQKRANNGHFFVKTDDCDDTTLQSLSDDDIIKYDSNAGGYFITHDIYEEWALDKIIERNYTNSEDYEKFFDSIGSSLPIRRAFRNWLSEKLFTNQESAKQFIEKSFPSNSIVTFWKDELLVSVLLSDYSEMFFQLFEKKLLEDDQKLLVRIAFLLRIACKEIDETFLSLLGLQKTDGISLKTLFTRPKGTGWICAINFIHKHKETFGLKNINTFLPLLADWNDKNTSGETTKKASQIGLFYYEEIIKNDGLRYRYGDDKKDLLIKVILQGTSEIRDELISIFNEIIARNNPKFNDRDYELVKTILSSTIDNIEVIKSLPDYVIRLADLFWIRKPKKSDMYDHFSMGVEKDFGLADEHDFEYFPASALQTPVFQLLRFYPIKTINFILRFTNKAIESYVKSELRDETSEVEVYINETKVIKQYISSRLWNTYRGTQGSAHVLESMHMALEKWLLEYAKIVSPKELETICIYLIENSKSTSITSVVTSIVLAQPTILFNVAKILFRTKEFFVFDTTRLVSDQSAQSLYSIGYGVNYMNKIYQDERIRTCKDEHRKKTLESIALEYQLFRTEDVTESEAENRQKTIWAIFDEYYKNLENIDNQTETDKTWRLYLARMDRRKMHPEIEKKDKQLLINFNPELDQDLKKYSDDSLYRISESMKYSQLKLWSTYRFNKEEDNFAKYQQYEANPQLAITETKEILETLKNGADETYCLFNQSIPAYTCSVLIRDFSDKMTLEEKEFCKELIMELASIPILANGYTYQVSDGTEPVITTLPELLKYFPEAKEEIKSILLLLLLNAQREISLFATRGILNTLWDVSFEEAHSMFLGYLIIKPKFQDYIEKIREENYKKDIYEFSVNQCLEGFVSENENELEDILSNKVDFENVGDLKNIDLKILNTAFELLPLKTKNEDHVKFMTNIFPLFAAEIFKDNHLKREERFSYMLENRFLDKFAYLVLTSEKEAIQTYIKPFIENLDTSRGDEHFFSQFIVAEDRLNQYEEFWIAWSSFYEKIVEITKMEHSYHYTKEIIYNYLLAWPYWKESAKEWHSLKEREKLFYKKVADDMGHYPPVLYSISKVLNDIGSNFIEDGIIWISNILEKNGHLLSEELEVNTIYYIESIARRYVLTNRRKIKTNILTKNQMIIILNFLIERGSITGYLLREDIL